MSNDGGDGGTGPGRRFLSFVASIVEAFQPIDRRPPMPTHGPSVPGQPPSEPPPPNPGRK